jgi:hypothetical protein
LTVLSFCKSFLLKVVIITLINGGKAFAINFCLC